MPIPRDRFEAIDDGGIMSKTDAEQIIEFLLRNQDFAYRMNEITQELDIPRGSVGLVLKRFEDDGVVVHRNRYWAIDESYAATREGTSFTSATAVEYDDGKGFDTDAWTETAEDQPATDSSG
jgi:predicted transcriptional regulator